MMTDTIAAVATAPGQGGIGIVRMSGPEAERILMKLFHPAGAAKDRLESHRLYYGFLMNGGEKLDECMAVLMRAPKSYTREDVAEIQLHGGGYLLNRVLEACISAGARLAGAGEFTRRAFENGRIDLSQAEAVMSLISARGAQEHAAAVRQLDGSAGRLIREASGRLYRLQAGIAACVDYPEEVSEEEGTEMLLPGLRELIGFLRGKMDERGARLIEDGLHVALIGRPNVGKSSLLNALLGEERAIVTAIPGTTRDLVEGEIYLNGVRVVLTDTAGLRPTEDPVEKIGVARSERAMEGADRVALVLDASEPFTPEDENLLARLGGDGVILLNKSDLPEKISLSRIRENCPDRPVFRLSAMHPDSLEPFLQWLRETVAVSDRLALTKSRHLNAARRAVEHLESALAGLEAGMPVDLASVDLQAAQEALGEITGDQVSEKLLDAVFAGFCVGK